MNIKNEHTKNKSTANAADCQVLFKTTLTKARVIINCNNMFAGADILSEWKNQNSSALAEKSIITTNEHLAMVAL